MKKSLFIGCLLFIAPHLLASTPKAIRVEGTLALTETPTLVDTTGRTFKLTTASVQELSACTDGTYDLVMANMFKHTYRVARFIECRDDLLTHAKTAFTSDASIIEKITLFETDGYQQVQLHAVAVSGNCNGDFCERQILVTQTLKKSGIHERVTAINGMVTIPNTKKMNLLVQGVTLTLDN